MSGDFILAHEALIRMGFFVGIFVVVALVEVFDPRRPLQTSKASRWFGNISIVAINTVVLRLLFPAGAVGIAIWVGETGVGMVQSRDLACLV